MQKNILLNLVAGVSLAVSGLIAFPVNAQDNQSDITGANVFNNPVTQDNQSDITGTNVFNNTVPGLFEGNKLSNETVGQAEELSQKLADTYRSCRNINRDTTECLELNKLLQDSKTFLGNINQQLEKVRANQVNRPW